MDRKNITPEMNDLLKRTSTPNAAGLDALRELAIALEVPLRQGVMAGDIVTDIFSREDLGPDQQSKYPLDLLAPGTEKRFVAYAVPNHGRIPERTVEGDYFMVPVFTIADSIDWLLEFSEEARWDIVARAMQVLEDSFVKKINDDGWHTLLTAAVDRNIVVYDNAASAGQFTKRLVSLGKTIMRRQGGGNSSSVNRGKLTDLYLSPEGVEDIRDWGVDQLDDVSRRQVFTAPDGSLNRIFQVNLHDIDELGEDQEYQTFFSNQLSGSLGSGDVELLIGLDKSRNDSFVMPVRKDVELFEDPTMHRQMKAGYYGWTKRGFGCCDNRRVIALSM